MFGGDKQEQPRDSKTKRFVKGPSDKPVETQQQNVQPNTQSQPDPNAPKPIDPNRVPDSWRGSAKAQWDKLPPDIKAEINKREGDYRNGLAMHRQKAAFADDVSSAFTSQHLQSYQQAGVQIGQVVKEAAQIANTFNFGNNEQRVQALRDLVERFKIKIPGKAAPAPEVSADPTQVPVAQPQFDPSQFRDPRVDQLVARFQQQEQQVQQRQQTEHQQQLNQVHAELDDFANNPDNEHLALVWDTMAGLLEAGVASNLKEAYDKAVKLDPTASAASAAKAKVEADKQAAAAAADARRAAGVRPGGKPNTFVAGKSGPVTRTSVIEDQVRAFLNKTSATE